MVYVVTLYGYQPGVRKEMEQFGQCIMGELFSKKNKFFVLFICFFHFSFINQHINHWVSKEASSDINFGDLPLPVLPFLPAYSLFPHSTTGLLTSAFMICFYENVIHYPCSFPLTLTFILKINFFFTACLDYSFTSIYSSQFLPTSHLLLINSLLSLTRKEEASKSKQPT